MRNITTYYNLQQPSIISTAAVLHLVKTWYGGSTQTITCVYIYIYKTDAEGTSHIYCDRFLEPYVQSVR
jgi:hypothetical protein